MSGQDQRVDAYIAGSADFAKPILKHLRQLVHESRRGVEETIKWSHPTFLYKGMLGGMAAFKKHCAFGFWKHALIPGLGAARQKNGDEAMGQLGRITCLSDLPPDKVLLGYLKEAIRLNEEGIQVARTPRPQVKRELIIPDFFTVALKKNKKARAAFEKFSPSHQREYIEWLTEAKREETRSKRLETTLAWLTEGKPRHWKHTNCQPKN